LPPEVRRVVLDEDINWKLMHGLQGRGRLNARAVAEPVDSMGLKKPKDGALFKALAAGWEPFVLVTWDNKMPIVHRAELDHHRITLAVVDERWFKRKALPESEQEDYIRDVVHRWLHRIELLSPAERRYFSPTGSRKAT
jgi:hypothetical protein